MPRTTGILIFEDVEELDFAGPWEVFAMAAKSLGERADEEHVVTIAEKEGPVRSAHGLRVLPDFDFENAPDLDVLLVPGGQGTRREVSNPVLIDWIRKASARCTWVTSVCTGALLLHEAGVARGKRVTTHWGFIPTLRERGDVTVLDNVRYVRDGNLVTAAGVSAGIDMALWLVGQIHGREHARTVQRLMEYDPAPPYTAEV
jgi:transcriptional regulator GlxA family with amidase domain